MKLGIAVVYVVPEENEDLLDLHLSQIEKNTQVPYVIYAAANRLAARFRDKLAAHPQVMICNLPNTGCRGTPEHAFYLDRLVVEAIADGATHVCTLHLDSFPIRNGWATDLAARLTGKCVLAGVVVDELYARKPNTACMMFTREFYLEHRPTFLLPPEILDSSQYREYARLWKHHLDSGVGYGFKIFSEGLSWIQLGRTDKGPGGQAFGIFGDVILHLGGSLWVRRELGAAISHGPSTQLAVALDRRLGRVLRSWIPRELWVRLMSWLPRRFVRSFFVERLRNRESDLANDPARFLQDLRTGGRH